MDRVSRICFIVEIKVCFDLYLEYAYLEKIERYKPLLNIHNENGWNVKLFSLCFGSRMMFGNVYENRILISLTQKNL